MGFDTVEVRSSSLLVPTISFLTVSPPDPNCLSQIQNFLYCFCTAEPFEPGVSGVFSVLKVIGEKRMTVTVYARHSSKCSKSGEREAGQYKRCKCPLWLRWGKDGKKSAKTRSLGHRHKGGTQARTRTRTGSQWHRASKEARPHHHRVGCRSLPKRHESAVPLPSQQSIRLGG